VAQVTATSAPNRLALCFPAAYTFSKAFCERAENLGRLERTLAEVTGGVVRLEFSVSDAAPASEAKEAESPRRQASPGERLQEKAEHPLVRKAIELFAARPVRLEDGSPKVQS
jgi:DNA polymerase-3 subunit gamma/tau